MLRTPLIDVVRQIERHLVRRTPCRAERQRDSEDQSDDFSFARQLLSCLEISNPLPFDRLRVDRARKVAEKAENKWLSF